MRLTSRQKKSRWKDARRMAFWDQPNYGYFEWRQFIDRGDNRTVSQSIQYMRPIDFIQLVDIDYFVRCWLDWREDSRIKKMRVNRILLDALWGDYVMGNALVVPNEAFMSLTKKQKDTYNVASRYHSSLSKYELAKKSKRNYRRILDDVSALVDKKLFKKERTKRNNRTVDLISIMPF